MADLDLTDVETLRAAFAPSASCATLEQLGRLCDRDHVGSADTRVAEHVATCLRCRTELALLKQFESGALRPDEQEDVRWIAARLARDVARLTAGEALPIPRGASARRTTAWRRFLAPRALAASLAVAAAGLVVVLNVRGRDGTPPALPDVTAGPSSFRSDAIPLKGPAGDLDVAPKELRWEPAAGAATYSVQVMEVDRTPVWSADSREASIALPASVRARVVPGKPFLWQVVAKDAGGQAIASSDMQRFRLRLRTPKPE
jgi:hypothetical protein